MLSLVLCLFFVPFVDRLAIDGAETRLLSRTSNCLAVQVGPAAFHCYQRGAMIGEEGASFLLFLLERAGREIAYVPAK